MAIGTQHRTSGYDAEIRHGGIMHGHLNWRGTNPEVIGLTTKDATARPEKAGLGLITLIEELAGGPPDSPWMSPPEIGEKPGEGGTISYDKTHFALTIRQTTRALDDIAGLLVQLRRDRYQLFHGTAPPEAGAAVNRLPMPAR